MELPWARLVALGCVGLVMGVLSIYAVFPTPLEFALWSVIALFLWAPLLARWAPQRPLVAGLVVGLVSGITTGGVQAAFQRIYLEHWPAVATQFAGWSFGMVALYFLGFALVAGAATGLVAGLVAWGIRSWKARRNAVVV
jgi:hypothetical protein